MALLNRATPNIFWAGKPPLALMYGSYQVWPAPPPPPTSMQVTSDTGPDGIGSDSGWVTFSATRNGVAFAVSGASVRIDDMDGDPPVLNWSSFGNLQRGDVVTLVFRNEAITYMGGRTLVGTMMPSP